MVLFQGIEETKGATEEEDEPMEEVKLPDIQTEVKAEEGGGEVMEEAAEEVGEEEEYEYEEYDEEGEEEEGKYVIDKIL